MQVCFLHGEKDREQVLHSTTRSVDRSALGQLAQAGRLHNRLTLLSFMHTTEESSADYMMGCAFMPVSHWETRRPSLWQNKLTKKGFGPTGTMTNVFCVFSKSDNKLWLVSVKQRKSRPDIANACGKLGSPPMPYSHDYTHFKWVYLGEEEAFHNVH